MPATPGVVHPLFMGSMRLSRVRSAAVLAGIALAFPLLAWPTSSGSVARVDATASRPAADVPQDITPPENAPYAWGDNTFGELGRDNQSNPVPPTPPGGIVRPSGVQFTSMAAGGDHALAVDTDGLVLGWGDNTFGQIGNGGTTASLSPTAIDEPSGEQFTAVSAGSDDSMALTANGTVYTWGLNTVGQLGIGTTVNEPQPTLVDLPTGVVATAISAGSYSDMVLTSTGTVYTWGLNTFGQLGDDTTANSAVPVPVAMPPGVIFTAVAAGATFDLALSSTGTIYAWGNGESGQLGDGLTDDSSGPVQVQTPAGVTYSQIAAGGRFALALATDGSVWSWGNNDLGELGQNSIVNAYTPSQVFLPAAQTFVSISAGDASGYAVSSGGIGWSWGSDEFGQLGDGATTNQPTPIKISQPANTSVSYLVSGSSSSMAMLLTGTNQSVNLGTIPALSFGDPPLQVPATSTSGLPVSFSASGDCTYPGNQLIIISAGSCVLTAEQTGSYLFNPAPPVTVTLPIAQVPLTLTAENAVGTIGSIPSFGYTLSGFVNGNTANALTGSAACTTTATAASGVGTYPITCTAGTLYSPNYYIATSVPGQLQLNPSAQGYALIGADGSVFAEGPPPGSGTPGIGFYGSANTQPLNAPLVGAAFTPDKGGYWLVGGDGGIFSYGDAHFFGSTGNLVLNRPVVGMAPTPDGNGYWLVASDGGIFAFGDAQFYGSTGAMTLNKPILAMTPTADGGGYWLVASDGGIFAFGDAQFYGSTGSLHLTQNVVGMAITPSGTGYWLVTTGGDVYNFGGATFEGSLRFITLNQPVVGIVATTDGLGYTLADAGGGVYCFGDATFWGSLGNIANHARIVAII